MLLQVGGWRIAQALGEEVDKDTNLRRQVGLRQPAHRDLLQLAM